MSIGFLKGKEDMATKKTWVLAGEFPNTLQKAVWNFDVPFKFGVIFQSAAVCFWKKDLNDTVDGQNPAPPGMVKTL